MAAAQALSDGKLRPTKTLSDVLTLDPVSPKLSTVTSRGSFVQLLGDPASPVSPTAVVGLPLDSDPEAGPGGAPGAETTTPGVRHQHGLQVVLVGASSSSCQGPTSITTGGAATARRLTGSIVGRGSMVAALRYDLEAQAQGLQAGSARPSGVRAQSGLKTGADSGSEPALPAGIVPSYLTTTLLGLALCMYTGTEVRGVTFPYAP